VSYAARLIHTLSVVSEVDTGDLDDYGQPITSTLTRSVSGLPQPKRIREVTRIHESGAVIGSWTVFLAMDTVTEADIITHTKVTCPVPDANDLPDTRWNITGVRNAAGIGHHLEVDASVVEGAAVEAAAS
jgi:hypothetical protein